MKYMILLLVIQAFMSTPHSYDFGTNCIACEDWFVVLDGVMGGRSTGELERAKDSYILRGEVSLENNGGFASLRTSYAEFDLSQYTTVRIRYRSTGQDFGFTLNKFKRFWYPNFKVNLPVSNGEWVEEQYLLKDFGKYRLGQKMQGTPSTNDLSQIIRLGFISNTKAATAYTFEVDSIVFE